MNNQAQFHLLMRKYIVEYLPVSRNHSAATIRTYRQALNSFRSYIEDEQKISFENMDFHHFSKDNIYLYTTWLRETRLCSNKTINLRLSVIKSFLRFCGEHNLELMTYYVTAASIHEFKEIKISKVEYLTQKQLKQLFQMPDASTKLGRRNRFFMIFTYETGMRMQEALDLKLSDIHMSEDKTMRIRIHGKGDKTRYVPLMSSVSKHLNAYLKEFHPLHDPSDYLFYTIHQYHPTQMQSGTVDAFLKKTAKKAHEQDASFPLCLHEHMLRHSIAMAMHKKGIPISYIRDFLGHSCISTTMIYAYSDEEMIADALKAVSDNSDSIPKNIQKEWKSSKKQSLLEFCNLV